MRPGILDGTFCVCVVLALLLSAFPGIISAQTVERSAPEQAAPVDSSKGHSEAPRKSSVAFDTTPGVVLAAPRAIEISGQNIDYTGGQSKPDNAKGKTGEIVVAPFPISNPALGSGIVLVSGYLFPISKKDESSPSSMLGGGAFYTSNGSWVWALGTKLYLKQDRFRLTAAYGHAQLHYDLYGIGNSAGNVGISVPMDQGGRALALESLVRLKGKLFLGPRYQWRDLNARFKGDNVPPELNIDPIELNSTTSALGFHLQQDLRDSQFYPTSGSLTDVVGDFFQGTFGSDFSYQSYTFAFNKYSGLSPRQVIAFRVSGCATSGRVPFYDMCLLGMHNDIRGYKTGRFRDRLMLTTQAEYRLQLPKRFGLAAFFGVGEVAPELGAFNNDNLKPGGGAGIRYMVAKKNHVNLRVDYAVGLQGSGIYMGVTEAF